MKIGRRSSTSGGNPIRDARLMGSIRWILSTSRSVSGCGGSHQPITVRSTVGRTLRRPIYRWSSRTERFQHPPAPSRQYGPRPSGRLPFGGRLCITGDRRRGWFGMPLGYVTPNRSERSLRSVAASLSNLSISSSTAAARAVSGAFQPSLRTSCLRCCSVSEETFPRRRSRWSSAMNRQAAVIRAS
jgi:hypothetical protein